MTPSRAGALIVFDALARGVPPELQTLAPTAARYLAQGQLARALEVLRVDPVLAAGCARWPAAGRAALARFDRIPTRTRFSSLLTQTLAYLGLVMLVQVVVVTALVSKVMPALEQVSGARGSGFLDALLLGVALVLVLLVPLALWVALGTVGWERLPGWARALRRAKEAALGAALHEAGAPEDVRAEVHRSFKTLQEPALGALELDEVFERALADSEASLERFVISVRVMGLGLATLLALAVVVGVYGSLSRVAWLG